MQAKVTHDYDVEVPDYGDHAFWPGPPIGTKMVTRTATDGVSEWSQPQTISVPETSSYPSLSPEASSLPITTEASTTATPSQTSTSMLSPSPSIPEFPTLPVSSAGAVAFLSAAITIFARRRIKEV